MTALRPPLAELVENLGRRGGMYVQPFAYDTVVAYVAGYDHALRDGKGESDLDGFQRWLDDRVGHHCSLHWAAVVRDVFAKGDKTLALKKFFELFREFSKGGKKGGRKVRRRAVKS